MVDIMIDLGLYDWGFGKNRSKISKFREKTRNFEQKSLKTRRNSLKTRQESLSKGAESALMKRHNDARQELK